MRIPIAVRLVSEVSLLILCASACATFRTISAATPGSPKVFSGTRLNVRTLMECPAAARAFGVAPPVHPRLDLPASIAFDTLALLLTLPVATYELVFE